MHYNQSLLGQFFTRIKGSQEDIATEGINYLLNRSMSARKAISSLIKNNVGIELPELSYRTQVIGENLERPDIVGFNSEGQQLVIIESKFWSSLTDNQPNAYLNRLHNSSSILLFICPSLRLTGLWQEIASKLSSDYFKDDIRNHAYFDGKHVIVKKWNEVLTIIRENLVQNNENLLVSDVDQIIGLCNVIDQNTFLPLNDEDLSPSIPRRISSYYDLLDKVLDEIKNHLIIDLSGMKATAQRSGYVRYFKFSELGLSLQLNYELWRKELDTPFWIGFQKNTGTSWRVDNDITLRVNNSGKSFYYVNQVPHYPLIPERNVIEDNVVSNLTKQAVNIIKLMSYTSDRHSN